jgi:hypothetical protein
MKISTICSVGMIISLILSLSFLGFSDIYNNELILLKSAKIVSPELLIKITARVWAFAGMSIGFFIAAVIIYIIGMLYVKEDK